MTHGQKLLVIKNELQDKEEKKRLLATEKEMKKR